MAVPPLDELPREVGGLGLISRGSANPEEEEEEEEEDGEVCALGSSGGSGAISGGGSGGWEWDMEARVKARGLHFGRDDAVFGAAAFVGEAPGTWNGEE